MSRIRGLGVVHALFIVAAVQSPEVSANDKTLVFPGDIRVGTILLCDPPRRTNGFIDTSAKDWVSLPAIGPVTIPDDRYVGIELGNVVSSPAVRRRFSLDGIHAIWISGRITKEMVRWIASCKTLFELRFLNATFTVDAFDEAPEMQKLAILSVFAENPPRPLGPGLARWCSRMPGLEYLYVRPALTNAESIELEGHPRLAFFNVEVTDQKDSPFEMLARLPALRGLNLDVGPGNSAELIAGIDRLVRLEVINWNQGHADAQVVNQLSKLDALRALRFHQCTVGADLVDALPELSTVDQLSLHPRNWDESAPHLARLPEALFKMPRLRSWPALRSVDLNTLKRISLCDSIQHLEIEGVHKSVTSANVANWDVTRLTQLKYLELRSVPIDDAWLKQLSDARELETLRLDGTRVAGNGLDALKHLSRLKRIGLGFEQGFETALEGLAECRSVTHVEIYGELRPRQFEPLKNCRQLEELIIWDGVTDDVTAEWLGQMTRLDDLDLGDCCYMTDRGAALLAKLPRLQHLSIGGTITAEGIASLAKAPLLTRLDVHSTQLTEDDQERLKHLATTLSDFHVNEYRGGRERVEHLLLKGP